MMKSSCVGCPMHLWFCKAECCKMFTMLVTGDFRKGVVYDFGVDLDDDMKHYYKLHGVTVIGNHILRIKLKDFDYEPGRLTIYMKCKALTKDLMCSLHNKDTQPIICTKPNISEGVVGTNAFITPRCMYKETGGLKEEWKIRYQKTN